MLDVFLESVQGIWAASGFANVCWQQLVMIGISCVLVYLAITKGFEPLLLMPIAFGMLLTNPRGGYVPPRTSSNSRPTVRLTNARRSEPRRPLGHPVPRRQAGRLSAAHLPRYRLDDRLRPADRQPQLLPAGRRCPAGHLLTFSVRWAGRSVSRDDRLHPC